MIGALAAAPAITVVVGAGVSAEAGLPSWQGLLNDLLSRAGTERLRLDDEGILAAWIEQILRGESPLGAAAVAEALAGDALADWVPESLYGDDPGVYQPGPTARQVAELRRAYGAGLRLLTTNYDDLVEQSIADADLGVEPVPFTGPDGPPVRPTDASHQRVVHLHGFLPRSGASTGAVVLSEDDYQRVAREDWQRSEVGSALMNGPCLFIGSSLTDPNLLRYLHVHSGSGSPEHFAIFTRQDVYASGTSETLIGAREAALSARWRTSRLEIIFVDHYGEVAQALAEIALAKRRGTRYEPLPKRLKAWRRRLDDELLLSDDPVGFAAAQDMLHDALRDALQTALGTAGAVAGTGADEALAGEVLAAALWIVDEAGATITSWATTDRVHRDPSTIEPIEIDEHSQWVAVRAFTRGAALGEPRDVYASRWRYIRGLPIFAGDRLPSAS